MDLKRLLQTQGAEVIADYVIKNLDSYAGIKKADSFYIPRYDFKKGIKSLLLEMFVLHNGGIWFFKFSGLNVMFKFWEMNDIEHIETTVKHDRTIFETHTMFLHYLSKEEGFDREKMNVNITFKNTIGSRDKEEKESYSLIENNNARVNDNSLKKFYEELMRKKYSKNSD